MDRTRYVSEAEVAYWASVFPAGDVPALEVHKSKFNNVDLEVQVFDFPSLDDKLQLCSIEQNLSIDRGEAFTLQSRERPVRRGYRMAWYRRMCTSPEHIPQYLLSALQFGRCFRLPPKAVHPRTEEDRRREERNAEYRLRHADRLQHMSGRHNMTTKELRIALCSRNHYGVNFCHFVLQALKKGMVVMSVEVMRFWVAEAICPTSLRDFMETEGYRGEPLCALCQLRVLPDRAYIVKVGSRWVQVSIEVDSTRAHVRDLDDLHVFVHSDNRVIMEVEHVVSYTPFATAQLHDVYVGRAVRWFQRYLRVIRFDLDQSDSWYSQLVRHTLLSSLRSRRWGKDDHVWLYWMLKAFNADGVVSLPQGTMSMRTTYAH